MTDEYTKKLEEDNSKLIKQLQQYEAEIRNWKQEAEKYQADLYDAERSNEKLTSDLNREYAENQTMRKQWDTFVNSEVALQMSESQRTIICQNI